MPPALMEVVTRPSGEMGTRWHLHAGQKRAMLSQKRFVLALAGWQAGKSVVGPPWLLREMKTRGAGDYLIGCPTFQLMQKKVLPEFLRLFERHYRLGKFTSGKNSFSLSKEACEWLWGKDAEPSTVFFGHAGSPESLESATYKGAWLDEAGQTSFRLGSYEAVIGRLSIYQGRILFTTRPYSLGWLKQQLWDPWVQAGRNHPLIDVVNFRSIDNPAFPREEYERARSSLPGWKFRMMYDGIFEKPAGAIYDCFDTQTHTCPRFAIPDHWPRYLGLDFGGVNTCGVFFAEETAPVEGPPRAGKPPLPDRATGKLYAYRVYGPCGSRTAKEHVVELLRGEPRRPVAVGGAASEDQWRAEFAQAGLAVKEPPIKEVEVGINRVYGSLQRNELMVFDDLQELIDDFGSYSREVDEAGEPTEDIEAKETWHRLDAVRYALAYLRGGKLAAGSWGLERI